MSRNCTLVVCGAPLAVRAVDVARALAEAGWQVRVILTDASAGWVPTAPLEQLGLDPQSAPRSLEQPKAEGRADVIAVVPATFNTVAKLATGIADSLAHSVLCEALGDGTPIVAVPMVNTRLWGHPAWAGHTRLLGDAGVVFLDPHTGEPGLVPVASGTGEAVTEKFDPAWLIHQVDLVVARV